jgi:SPW repeat
MITSKTHASIDYLTALMFIGIPWIFNFARFGGPATIIFVAMALSIITYSFFTDYELGAIHMFSLKLHLLLDVLCGAFLISSPWLFHFNEVVYLPHVIVGFAFVVLALLTNRIAYTDETEYLYS